MQAWLYLVVLGAAIWVGVDASKLGARRGALGGGMLDMGPAGWFFACLLFWIVTVPCYLVTRPKLVRRARVLSTHPQFAAAAAAYVPPGTPQGPVAGYGMATGGYQPGFAPPVPTAPMPPPGWYPSPDGPGMRWWDGTNWTGHTA